MKPTDKKTDTRKIAYLRLVVCGSLHLDRAVRKIFRAFHVRSGIDLRRNLPGPDVREPVPAHYTAYYADRLA